MAIIYQITNTINGKQYIGQTSYGLDARWHRHCADAFRGSTTHLHNAIRKYGSDAFTTNTLEVTSIEDLDAREIYWITELNTKETGYNMTEGGGGTRGWKHSQEWRIKMSASKMGANNPNYGKTPSEETRAKLSSASAGANNHWYGVDLSGENNPFYGKSHSEETKSKLSVANKGRKLPPRTDEHRAKLSAALSGEKSPNYGKKFSDETKAKLSAIHKGKKLSDEHRAKLSAARKASWMKRRLQKEAVVIHQE